MAMKSYTPTELRRNIYQIIDDVIETGEPVEIRAKQASLKLVSTQKRKIKNKKSIWESLKGPKRNIVVGDSEDLVHIDWSKEWNPGSF